MIAYLDSSVIHDGALAAGARACGFEVIGAKQP